MKPTFPELQNVADSAAIKSQKVYLRINALQLALLAASALVAGINSSLPIQMHLLPWAVCILMGMALLCTTSLRIGKFDVRWFKCRAFAENAKSLVWRYVMAEGDQCENNRDTYLREWGQLKSRLPELQREFALTSMSGELITRWMIEASVMPLEDKLSLYRQHRVHDQIKWYAKSAKQNALKQSQWFWSLFLIEAIAIAYAAIQAWLLSAVNEFGFIVALGSGIVAWTQLKRFSDLSTSYAIAAEDITLIAEKHAGVLDKAAASTLVDDIEEAVSREHSMWLARRTC